METGTLQQNHLPPVPDLMTWTQMERLMWMTVMTVSGTHQLAIFKYLEPSGEKIQHIYAHITDL